MIARDFTFPRSVTPTVGFRDTPTRSLPLIALVLSMRARSGRMPRESLDASENLPKEFPRQVALGELEHEVPGMADQASTGLEEPLLETGRFDPPWKKVDHWAARSNNCADAVAGDGLGWVLKR